MLSRYQELKSKLESALKDPSINVIKLSQEGNSIINELENIYKSSTTTCKTEYEKEFNKFMSLHDSLKAYMFPLSSFLPSPDRVSDYDKVLRDLDNYYNITCFWIA
jgi:uncharacterized FlgJ-related protein